MFKTCFFAFTFTLMMICQAQAAPAADNHEELALIIPTDSVDIGGSLTLPEQMATPSLVIMLSGSGPQDRDETLDGFKVFRELSGHLAAQGIASFRFDDRGVGASTGHFNESTLEDHTQDVHNIIRYFTSHAEHAFTDFVLLGHSQGGIVSGHVAVSNPAVSKVILMGAPSVPLIDIVLYQVRLEYDPAVFSQALIEREVSAHNQLMWAIRSGKNIDTARQAFKQSTASILSATPPAGAGNATKTAEQIEAKVREFEYIYAMPSLTSFLYHDTAKDYEKLSVPVLSLFGGKDLQVTIDQNKDVMEKALLKGQVPYTFVTFDEANHYFQKAMTGHRDEYEKLDKRFVAGFLETVSEWIVAE